VIIFSAFSLWLIPRSSLKDAPLMFGFFVGMSFILSLVLIEQMCIWGAEWNLIDNLDKLSDFSSVLLPSVCLPHVCVPSLLCASFAVLVCFPRFSANQDGT